MRKELFCFGRSKALPFLIPKTDRAVRKNFKKLLLALLSLGATQQVYAQSYPGVNWLQKGTGSGGADDGRSIAYDASGNMYVAGSFQGEFNPDNSGASTDYVLVSKGSTDMYIAKYNSTGGLVWAFGVGDANADQLNGIAVDGSGNVYIAGYITGTTSTTVDADPSSNTNTVTGATATSAFDQFVAKYDGTLTPSSTSFYKWAFTTGGVGNDAINSIAVDGSGNLYIGGYITGTTGTNIDADPSSNTNNVTGRTATNNNDHFIAKYDGTLTPASTSFYKWAFTTGGTASDMINSIALDGSGNVYAAGFITGTTSINIDADPSSNTNNVTGATVTSSNDHFVAKYDGTLDPSNTSFYKWAFTTGGTGADVLNSITIDGSSNVYVAGSITGTTSTSIDADPSSNTNNVTGATVSSSLDHFAGKYDGTSDPANTSFYKWAFVTGGDFADQLNAISVDGTGGVYVAGYITANTSFTVDADPSSNTNNLTGVTTTNAADMYMAKYDGTLLPASTSFYQWAFAMGGTAADQLNNIAVSSSRIYTAGTTASGAVDVDPSSNVNNVTATTGAADIIAMTYDVTVTPSSTSFYKVAIHAGNTSSSPDVAATAIDAVGNVYAAGTFGGIMVLGSGANAVTLQSKGSNDFYISKYNAAGTLLWAFSLGGTNSDGIGGIAVDANGNVYVGAYLLGTTAIDVDPSSNTNTVTGAGPSGDIFVAKYDGTLTPSSTSFYKWAFLLGAGANDRLYGIALDDNRQLYIAGSITANSGTNIDADPSSNTNYVNGATASTTQDQFVAKYDVNFDPSSTSFYKWAFTVGGTGIDYAKSIAVDGSGNAYVGGQIVGTTGTNVDADPSSNTNNVTGATGTNGSDVYMAKYDGNLDPTNTSFYKWAFTMGSVGSDVFGTISVDGSSNVYIASTLQGTTSAPVDADPSSNTNNVNLLNALSNSYDFFIAKYDGKQDPTSTSFYKWAFTMGTDYADVLNAVSVDKSGNVYVAGYTNATTSMTFDVDPSSNTNNLTGLTAAASTAQFVAKYNGNLSPSSTGFYKWAYLTGNGTASSALTTISVRNNKIVTGGYFSGSGIDFQPGANSSTMTSTQNGVSQALSLGNHSEGFTWTGATSTDWNTSSNWDVNNVPATGDFAYIPATGVTNEPTISSNNDLSDLTMDAGRTLTINSSDALSVTGIITNDATITGAGTLALVGTDMQAINGNGIYSNLELDNSNGAIIAGDAQVDITSTLTLTDGVLTTSDNLALKSSSIANTAIINPVVSGSISGNVTAERFIPAKRAYRFLTSGVTTTTSVYDNWQEGGSNVPGLGTHITGSNTGANGFDATRTGNPSMYTFNSATQLWVNTANTNVNMLTNGEGYRLMIRGDRTVDLSTNTPTPTNTVLRAAGTVRIGSVTYNTTGAGSTPVLGNTIGNYSLIGNPYIAPVDWTALSSTDLEATYHVWDPQLAGANGLGAYVSYNSITGSSNGSSDVNEFIQPYQSVFVVTSGSSPSITFSEGNKATSLTSVFKSSREEMYVQLFRAGQPKSADGVKVVFDSSFVKAVAREDAAKLTNVDENLAIYHDTTHMLSISGLPVIKTKDTVHLRNWKLDNNGNYTLRFDANNFEPSLQAALVDKYLNVVHAIKADDITLYPFTYTTGNGSSAIDRFMIAFERNTTSVATKQKLAPGFVVYPNPADNSRFNIKLNDMAEGQYDVSVYNAIGQLVHASAIHHGNGTGHHTIVMNPDTPTGIYTVKVGNGKETWISKITINR